MTPPELWADRDPGSGPDEPGWRVRVVPNLFPAFAGSPPATTPSGTAGRYRAEPSYGAHEVIIHSPDHWGSLADLPEQDAARVLGAYRRRLAVLRQRGGYGSVVVIVNQGKAAGASLEHAHSQVIASARRGELLQAEVERLQGHAGTCAACAMIAAERSDDRRIIEEKDGLLALCPWASALPYEALLAPERHQARFEDGADDQDHAVAGALGRLLRRLHGALGAGTPYNLVLHSAPPGVADFHWHLHLYPRITTYGGFELASGIVINVVDPDQAAAAYRNVSAP
jgi:UDPglucose--hexose-1-phosphate uridylyltransferase